MTDDAPDAAPKSTLAVPAVNGAVPGGASPPADPWRIDLSEAAESPPAEVIMPDGTTRYPVRALEDMNVGTYDETFDLYAQAIALDESVRKVSKADLLNRIKFDREAHGVLREMIRRLVPDLPPEALTTLARKHLARVAIEAWYLAGGPFELDVPPSKPASGSSDARSLSTLDSSPGPAGPTASAGAGSPSGS